MTKLGARKKSVKSWSSIITTLCTSHPKIASGKWTDNSCPFLYLRIKCCWERSIGASLGHNAWYQGPGVWRPDALFRFIFYFYWNNNESVHKWSGTPICTFQCYQIGNRRCPAKIWHTLMLNDVTWLSSLPSSVLNALSYLTWIGANFVGSSIRDLDTLISKMAETGDRLYQFFPLFSLISFLIRVGFQ